MARRTAYEPCMLCLPDEPCPVHVPKPTQKRAKKAPPLPAKADPPSAEGITGDSSLDITSIIGAPSVALSPGVTPTPAPIKQDAHAAMRARVRQAPAPQPVADEAPDPVMDDAIRALEPLLHPTEKRTHQAVLEQPRTIVRRAEQWRAKRGGN